MDKHSSRRGIRAALAALFALAATLGTLACGKDGSGLTDPPSGPGSGNPGPWATWCTRWTWPTLS